MSFANWILLKFLFYFEFVQVVSAVYCRYETPTGKVEHMFCIQKCCDAQDRYSAGSICCSYRRDHEIFIGAAMATLIVISVFAICFLYICCKQKIMAHSRQNQERHQNSRGRRSRRTDSFPDTEIIPTISSRIEPVLPPPYDALPPPYSQIGSESDSKTEGDKSHSFGPPPEYSLHDSSLP